MERSEVICCFLLNLALLSYVPGYFLARKLHKEDWCFDKKDAALFMVFSPLTVSIWCVIQGFKKLGEIITKGIERDY
jgi:hypothetical protein